MATPSTGQLAPKAKPCGRCKGTGQARYNHMNGDTHCYQCGGNGIQVCWPAAAKARKAADDQWACAAHYKLVGGFASYQNQLRRPVRAATETTPYAPQAVRATWAPAQLAAYEAGRARDSAAGYQLERRLTFWVGAGLEAMQVEDGKQRARAEAAAVAAYKAAHPATTTT